MKKKKNSQIWKNFLIKKEQLSVCSVHPRESVSQSVSFTDACDFFFGVLF